VKLTRQVVAGHDQPVQWRAMLADRHTQAIEALAWLT